MLNTAFFDLKMSLMKEYPLKEEKKVCSAVIRKPGIVNLRPLSACTWDTPKLKQHKQKQQADLDNWVVSRDIMWAKINTRLPVPNV
jgi:hypothetical protein